MRGRRELARTDLTVKKFLIDLCDETHAVRRITHAADTRIARMYWPERVEWSYDLQMEGWWAPWFSPFGNLSDAVALARHLDDDVRLTIEVVGSGDTRVTLFAGSLQVGVSARDPSPEYAVSKAVLNSQLVQRGTMSGYALGMGLDPDKSRPLWRMSNKPRIDQDEIDTHRKFGDIIRDGLGRDDNIQELLHGR